MEFIDTNVLLYAYDATSGRRHEQARQLVGRLGRSRLGAISVQVLQEFYVTSVRKIVLPLTPEKARARLRVLGRWPTHAPMSGDVLAASALSEDHQITFWDAMIIRSATELGCDRLWTEDLKDGQIISGVRISSPWT